MKKKILTISLLICITAVAQQVNTELAAANQLYLQQKYPEAELAYRNILANDPTNATAKYNLGVVVYKMKNLPEAERVFTENTPAEGRDMKNKSYYNLGVSLTRQKKLEESIEAYKHALRQDPADKIARENLQKALLELKKQKQQEQDEKNKQQQQKQSQSKLNQKQVEQQLQLLQQKEKQVQDRLNKNRTGGAGQPKDW